MGSDIPPLVLTNEQKYFRNKNEAGGKNGEYIIDNTIFESFIEENDYHYNNNSLKRKLSFSNIPIIKGQINEFTGNVPLKDVIHELQLKCPEKYVNITIF